MKWVAILVLLALIAVYVLLGSFGFVMSAFCFDAGTEPAAWQCFAAINSLFILPALICVLAGIVLLIRGRYRWSMAVAAIPALLAAIGLVVVAVANARY